MNSDPISVDIPTACRMSGLSRSFLYEVLAGGDVRSIKAGRRRLVLVDSLRAWLQSLSSGPLAQPAHRNKTVGIVVDNEF
jgi:hypothetical protein